MSILVTQTDEESPPSVQQLVLKWIHQESSIGRYNHSVSQSYRAIGDWYFEAKVPAKSIIFHRASYRIDMFLYGAITVGTFCPTFRQALSNRGLSENDYSTIQRHVAESVHFEMNGDMLRQLGMAQLAAHEYQKAIKVEEAAFGRENPCLATLWRKLACLIAIVRADRKHHWANEIDDMDRLNDGWLQRHTKAHDHHGIPNHDEPHPGFIPSKVCHALGKGDEYYKAMEFSQAVGRYSHGVTINRQNKSRSKSNGKHRSSRSRSRSNSNFLSNHEKTSPRHETKSPLCSTRDTKPRKPEEQLEMDKSMKELEMFLSNSAIRTDNLVVKSPAESKIKHTSDKKEKKDLASHQLIISTTKRIKKALSHSSSRSSKNDPHRPKSDSHVAKLARKVALKASKKIRKTMTTTGGSSSTPSSKVTSNPNRHQNHDVDVKDLDAASLPKSGSYAYMSSPPMTPLVNNTTAKLNNLLWASSPGPRTELYYDNQELSGASNE
jgi:tetratricopeptide (TPR) repeat protein